MLSKQVDLFIKVVECGSFSKAAEKTFTTSASVMKQMNSLEEKLGILLLERSTQGVKLTSAGKIFYADAKKIQSEAHSTIMRIKESDISSRPMIRVGTSLLSPSASLMAILSHLRKLHQEFQFKIVPFEDENSKIFDLLSSLGKEIDIVIGPYGDALEPSRYNVLHLGYCKICLAVPKIHRLSEAKLIECQDLVGERLMMFKRGEAVQINKLRDMLQVKYPGISIIDTNFTYDSSVFNDCEESGSILLTLDIWKDIHPALVTIPVKWDYSTPFGIMYPLHPTKDVLAFIEIVQKEYVE